MRFIWIWKFYSSFFWTKSQFFFSSFSTFRSLIVSNALSLSLLLLILYARLKKPLLFFLINLRMRTWILIFNVFNSSWNLHWKTRYVFSQTQDSFFDSLMIFCDLRSLLCFVDEKNQRRLSNNLWNFLFLFSRLIHMLFFFVFAFFFSVEFFFCSF